MKNLTSTKIVVDSSAWIEYLRGSSKAEVLNKYFENRELYTSSICVAEVTAKVLKEGFSSEVALSAIRSLSNIVAVDYGLSVDAGKIYVELRKKKPKFALADAISLVIAKKLNAVVVTFDNDFSGLKEAIVFK